jgi:BMFP domain-containing protein YqiC
VRKKELEARSEKLEARSEDVVGSATVGSLFLLTPSS